ncbi:hypothetical protein [Dietzia maris]|uniref:hypothetical protein n=1 Tax=Dietzia maris TaxID=37915 RepID=UPI0037CAF7E5
MKTNAIREVLEEATAKESVVEVYSSVGKFVGVPAPVLYGQLSLYKWTSDENGRRGRDMTIEPLTLRSDDIVAVTASPGDW